MKWLPLLLLLILMFGCSRQISIIEGAGEDPIWTVDNMPNGEVAFKRTVEGETVELIVKKESTSFNPITPVWDLIKLLSARLFLIEPTVPVE